MHVTSHDEKYRVQEDKMKKTGYFIICITKKYLSLDLHFDDMAAAENAFLSDLYTDRQRKIRRIVPSYENNGNTYIKLNGKTIRIVV